MMILLQNVGLLKKNHQNNSTQYKQQRASLFTAELFHARVEEPPWRPPDHYNSAEAATMSGISFSSSVLWRCCRSDPGLVIPEQFEGRREKNGEKKLYLISKWENDSRSRCFFSEPQTHPMPTINQISKQFLWKPKYSFCFDAVSLFWQSQKKKTLSPVFQLKLFLILQVPNSTRRWYLDRLSLFAACAFRS